MEVLGGTPYTPYDLESSSLRANWDLYNSGRFDFTRINGERLKSFHQLDLRVDKNITTINGISIGILIFKMLIISKPNSKRI